MQEILFYTLIFTKLSHQFIYSIHLFNKIIISFNIVISQHNPHSHCHQATIIINLASSLPLSNKIDTGIQQKKKPKNTTQRTDRQPTDPHPQSSIPSTHTHITITAASSSTKKPKKKKTNQRSRENQQPWSERVDLIHNRSATRLESVAWVGESEVIWWNERVDRWEWGERRNEKKREVRVRGNERREKKI